MSVLGPDQVDLPLTIKQGKEILGLVQVLGQSSRSRNGIAQIASRVSFGTNQGGSQRYLQIQFQLLPPNSIRESTQQLQTLLQLCNCFRHGRASNGLLTR